MFKWISVYRTVFLCLCLWMTANSLAQETAYQNLQGDAERGRLLFAKCRTCHFVEPYLKHYNGPWLFDIFGKEAGSQDYQAYSASLLEAKFKWTPELLYTWLSNPETFLSDSQMAFAPYASDQERADVIAFMLQYAPSYQASKRLK